MDSFHTIPRRHVRLWTMLPASPLKKSNPSVIGRRPRLFSRPPFSLLPRRRPQGNTERQRGRGEGLVLAPMEGFRSRSYNDGRMQLQAYGGRPPPPVSGTYDFRSYSMSYASSAGPGRGYDGNGSRDVKFDKGKGASGSSKKGWIFSDPEFQRKKRVASYKVYAVEGRMKGSFRRSFRWLKDKYTQVVYGWW